MFSSYYMDRYGHVAPNQIDQDAVPVAVIPFEDREQVERLARAFDAALRESDPAYYEGAEAWEDGEDFDVMQAALREFANPKPPKRPKPEEPTGLGAVVEDDQGVTWVRTHNHWRRADLTGISWDDLRAVRVLSEGVQP